jgi:hypothetical protein
LHRIALFNGAGAMRTLPTLIAMVFVAPVAFAPLRAQPLPGPPLSPYSAATVNDFLVACRADPADCTNEVGSAEMDKFQFDGSLCLPSIDYAKPVPGWLETHTETHAMRTEDGIYLALKTLYPCR